MEPARRKGAGESRVGADLLRVLWLPGLVFLAHLVLSGDFDLYTRYELTDELMHPAGGFAIAFAASRGLAELLARGRVPDPGRLLRGVLILSLTVTAAASWEIAEYLSDRYLGTRTLGDLEDTLLDLVLGSAGGLAFLAVDALRAREG